LGEHDFWAKNRMNMYEEIVHIPLFIYDPRKPGAAGQRRAALTQTTDLAPTFLDFFGVAPAPEMEAHSLLPVVQQDHALREAAASVCGPAARGAGRRGPRARPAPGGAAGGGRAAARAGLAGAGAGGARSAAGGGPGHSHAPLPRSGARRTAAERAPRAAQRQA